MKGKLATLAITGVLAVTLTGCTDGYYPYDYRYEYYSPYGHQGGPARSGYYPFMYDWYSRPLYGRGNYSGYPDPYQGSSPR